MVDLPAMVDLADLDCLLSMLMSMVEIYIVKVEGQGNKEQLEVVVV